MQSLGDMRVCPVTIGRIPKSDTALVGVAEEPASLGRGPLEPGEGPSIPCHNISSIRAVTCFHTSRLSFDTFPCEMFARRRKPNDNQLLVICHRPAYELVLFSNKGVSSLELVNLQERATPSKYAPMLNVSRPQQPHGIAGDQERDAHVGEDGYP